MAKSVCIQMHQRSRDWSPFSAMGSTDLHAMKGIPKQNSECVCVKEGKSPKGIHYSISFLFCPDPLIGICMTLHSCAVHCADDSWCQQQHICCCSPSLFCRQTAGNPQKLKSLDPATQAFENVFCCICASSSLHSPDWTGLMHLCYQCHATWLLFISCFPVLFSLHASFVLLSRIVPNSTMHNKNRRCAHVWV